MDEREIKDVCFTPPIRVGARHRRPCPAGRARDRRSGSLPGQAGALHRAVRCRWPGRHRQPHDGFAPAGAAWPACGDRQHPRRRQHARRRAPEQAARRRLRDRLRPHRLARHQPAPVQERRLRPGARPDADRARLCDYVNLLVVNASSPFRTLDELLAAARAKPGSLSYGSAGIGSSNHLSGELLAIKAGVTMTHVPYRGSALAMNDLLGGGLQFMFDAPNTSTPYLRAGKLRALGTTGRKRHRLFPDLPAIAESVPGYEFSGWMGLMAPAGLPKPIQQRLAAETEKGLATPGTGDSLSALGLDVN